MDRLEEIKRNNDYCSSDRVTWLISEIERLKVLTAHQQKLERKAIEKEDELNEERERLRKEKEWLINKIIRMGFMLDTLPYDERIKALTDKMQQALKEGE